jgi:hypothetical protein
MEFSKILSAVADKGWKVGLAAALASAAILLAHRLGFPDPTSLQPYLGATTVAGILGLAVVVVAVIDYVMREVGSGISEARDRAETQATRQRDHQQARSELEARRAQSLYCAA